MKHGSTQPDLLLTSPHFREIARNDHPMCPSPNCVSANIPPPQLRSPSMEGFNSIFNFWTNMEQASRRSASATMPRCNAPLANGFSQSRGSVYQPSSGTASDMDSISNSNSSKPQYNGHLKAMESSAHSEGSSDTGNPSAAYKIVAPPKSAQPLRPLPQPKIIRPLSGSAFRETVNIPKYGSSESRPILPEREESPPILPPKSPYLRPESRNNAVSVNGYQTMPYRNKTLPKRAETNLLPSLAGTPVRNGTPNLTNNTKPVVNNGTKYDSNRFNKNFRYSFNRPPEIPPKGASVRAISLYGADQEFGTPSTTTASHSVPMLNSPIGTFRVRYPTMSTTHAPTNVPSAKTKTSHSPTKPFSRAMAPRPSSTSRVVESDFCHDRLNGSPVHTNGYTNVSPNFFQGFRPKSEMGSNNFNRSISNRSVGIDIVNTDTPALSPQASDENLVTVRIRPNADGQFGFNVSGGIDHKKPVVISRVGGKMPAAMCCPRLNVGDQIVRINDRDISTYTQDQVIDSIRKTAESKDGVLELVVKSNIYLEENVIDDQLPDTGDAPPRPPKTTSTNRDASPLATRLAPPVTTRLESSSALSNSHYQNRLQASQSSALAHQSLSQSRYQPTPLPSPPKVTPKPRFGSANSFILKSTSGNGPRKALISDTEVLNHSIREIEAGLADGSLVKQFEKLERGDPNATMCDAKMEENVSKNRYRDISPYDRSRVRIHGVDGDYINASFVTMKVPKSNLQKKYIASQGPLPKTCADFWQMCWEQASELIVMLTDLGEQGRVKCDKYWPDLNHTVEFTWTHSKSSEPSASTKRIQLRISNVKEEVSTNIAYREFQLQRIVTVTKDMLNATGPTKRVTRFPNEKGPSVVNGAVVRQIVQLQYISWPDHGVPNNCSDLISFVERVRSLREYDSSKCAVVHCSAGIGRTGVLILLDTAMDMIRAHSPVHPVEMVSQMREHREMLIQTSAQFQFVCRAIVQYYDATLKGHKTKKS
ncbi:hypothetical protein Aperf_G00000078766 [Anoplocephala perfoliata]